MSREMVMKFWSRVGREGALREEFDRLMAARGDIPAADIVALGGRHGFSFTREDLKAALEAAASGDLTEAQLDAVAGGWRPNAVGREEQHLMDSEIRKRISF